MTDKGSGEGKVGAVYTIGHSTRSLEAFAALLGVGGVKRVIDIRTVPRSRTNPQYNQDSLPASLEAWAIAYERIAELGGLRKATASVPPEVNGFWSNRSFHNYADYALTEPFRDGLDRLLERASTETCAIMCAEAVWWRCHRRIVTDYLIAAGREVFHLMDPGRAEPARMNPAAVPAATGLQYPPAA
jgi:uncharacterized protein (DUF488 family)